VEYLYSQEILTSTLKARRKLCSLYYTFRWNFSQFLC